MSERASTSLAHRLLGRDVVGGPEHPPGLRQPVGLERAGDAEVGHLRPSLGVDEHVLGLHVAVDEHPRVRRLQPAPDLDRVGGRLVERQPPEPVDPLLERLAVAVLEDDVGAAASPRRRRSPRPRSGARPGPRRAPRAGSARSGRAGRRSRGAGPWPRPSARASRRGPGRRSTCRRCRASARAGSGPRAPSRSARPPILSSPRSSPDYLQPSHEPSGYAAARSCMMTAAGALAGRGQPRSAAADRVDDLRRRLLRRAGVERRLGVVLDPELDRLRDLVAGDRAPRASAPCRSRPRRRRR